MEYYFWKQPPEVFYKKSVLKNVPQGFNFLKKETPAQVFSCEFWEHFRTTASLLFLNTIYNMPNINLSCLSNNEAADLIFNFYKDVELRQN